MLQIDLAGNQLCGRGRLGGGQYTAEGIKAIADALRVSGSLSSINLAANELGVEGAKALVPALRDSGSLTSCNVLLTSCNVRNEMDVAAAELLVEAVKGRDFSLCGIQPDQTSADYSNQALQPADAVLLASDLSMAGVSRSLTSVE